MAQNQTGWATREALNYEGVSTEGPPPLDDGIYRVKIVEAEATTSKGGNPAIKYVVEALSAYDGSSVAGHYPKAYATNAVTAKTLFQVLRISQALGIDPPADSGYDTLCDFAEQMLGKECYARINQREYQGRVSNNLDRLMDDAKAASEASGGGGAPAEEPEQEATPIRRGRRAVAAE